MMPNESNPDDRAIRTFRRRKPRNLVGLVAMTAMLAGCPDTEPTPNGSSSSSGSGGSGGQGGSAGAGGEAGGAGQGGGGAGGGGGIGGAGGGGGASGWTERTKARVFLSGHSLTDDPLASYVLAIAQSLGRDFNYNQQIGIGSPIRVRTLGDSWNNLDWPGYKKGKNKNGTFDMNVIDELKNPTTLGAGEKYDTLVITERHDVLGTIQWEDTAGLLRHYHDRLIDGNPAGHTLFYHSWLDVDKADPSTWITHEKNARVAWECVANKVNLTLEAAGRSDRLTTLPVGAALVHLVEQIIADKVQGISGTTTQKLNMIFNDNVHLTQLGVYFAALVTYSAVFRSSPVGASVPQGVNSVPAADMQAIAWSFVSTYYTTPGSGEHTMDACRSFISQNVCSSFWTLQGNPGNITGCQNHFSNPNSNNGSNPFKWPDPNLMVWPDP